MRKRIISLVLAFCIVISLLVIPASAADTAFEITDTWQEIAQFVASGEYLTRYSVGDYKTIFTDAYGDIKMEIVAFDADTKSDGNGTAAITWLSKDLLAKGHAMNSTDTNANGWAASEMRTWLQDEVFAAIPAEVQSEIVSVDKTYYNKTTNSTLSISDNVWIPSYREVGLGTDREDSGVIYDSRFTDDASRVKNKNGSAGAWWLRSANRNDIYGFRNVYSDGSSASNSASPRSAYGVAFGFCTDATSQECSHTNTEIRNATDYYIGDSYCADCDKLLASGYNVISGWWQFNENIVAPLTAPLVENTSFTCCGTNYESFGWTGTDVGIYYDDVKVYDNITGWTNNIYRTVNLGDALVPVSEDFLTWLLANAVNLSYSDGVPLCIYDSDNSVLYPSFNASYGSVLTVTDTGFTITDPSGNIESYPCAPGIAGITFLGLSSSPDQTSAEYPVGTQIALVGATDLYVVLLELPIYAYLYSSDGQLLKILEGFGDSTLTVNSNSLVLTGVDGVSDVYNLSLGADETFLGLSLELNQNYSVNYSVGQSISLSSSKNFYLVSEYPYPVAVYWNAGGVIKYFTGLNSCTVRVNETSVDFIAHDGTVETLDIPLSGDDAFWGLATSPSQKIPTYRPGSTITVYDAKNLFIVRRSDYNKLVEQDIVLEDDYGVSAEVTETEKNTLLTILNKIRSWFHTGAVVGDIIGVVDSGEMFIFFSDETAAEIDTVPAMFSWRDDPYDTSAYDEKFAILNQIYGGGE